MWRVDKTKIPPDKLEHPELRQFCDEIQRTDPTLIKAICVHEAGHGVYMRRAGAKKLRFKGMTIFWDSDKNAFDVAAAAIAPIFDDAWVVTADNLDAVALFHAAGGVVTLALTEETNSMDREDIKQFRAVCLELPDKSIDVVKSWKRAQENISKDLRNPQLRKEIWKLEKEFEDWLLGGDLV